MPKKKYKCYICGSVTLVGEDYFNKDYVIAHCCSVSCYLKKNEMISNPQDIQLNF